MTVPTDTTTLFELTRDLLSPTAAQALGWALLHALWQGAAVALLLALFLRGARASGPAARYLTACAALALMLLLPVLTCAALASRTQSPPAVAYELVVVRARPGGMVKETSQIATEPSSKVAAPWLEPLLPLLVLVWLAGVALFSVRLLGGLWLLRKLKRRFNQPVSDELLATCRDLAARLGVTRAVRLRESLAVGVPVVIGWLRPVILLPTSTLFGLSPLQLELILAHELAHVRRGDYLVNVLQHLAETLLFYHPAVWWVSAKIREEREHLCDDLAVRACNGDKRDYAKALAKLDDMRLTYLAPAATGGSLLGRIERLAGKALPKTPNPTQWLVGLMLMLAPLGLSLGRTLQASPAILGTFVTAPFTVAELTAEGFSQGQACENAGPWMMVFSERGFFSGNILSEEGCQYQNPFVTGAWRLSGDTITFRDSQDLGCGTEAYSYSYTLRGEALALSPVQDSCPERVYLFTTHVWNRP